MVERIEVRLGEVFDVNVIAHARAVGGVVVGAVDRNARPPAGGRLAGDLDQMARSGCALADARFGVGARGVEVAQRDVAEVRRRGEVAQHPLGHQLRPTVRVGRQRRARLVGDAAGGLAVDGGAAREDELLDGEGATDAQQLQCVRGVVAVIRERARDRVGHDDAGREV